MSARANCASCHAPTVLVMLGFAIFGIQFALQAQSTTPGNGFLYNHNPWTAGAMTSGCQNELTMCTYPYNADGTRRNVTQSEAYKCWKDNQTCQANAVRGALTAFAIGRILAFLYLGFLIIYGAFLMMKKLT